MLGKIEYAGLEGGEHRMKEMIGRHYVRCVGH